MTADTCPQCHEPLPSPRPPLCPRCYFMLPATPAGDIEQGMADGSPWPDGSGADDPTRPMSAVSGQRMAAAQPTARRVRPGPPPVNPARAAGYRSRVRPWMIAIPAAAVLVLLTVLAVVFLRARGPEVTSGNGTQQATPSAQSTASSPTRLIRMDSGTIQASASSVLPPRAPYTYKAANTLDGDLVTAWNSDGEGSDGAEMTLTYTFPSSVRIGRIEFANGYQQDANTYARNRRVKTLTVATEGAERTFDITDTMGYQTLNFDFGATKKMVFTIVDFYPGNRYDDLAVSEVIFHRID